MTIREGIDALVAGATLLTALAALFTVRQLRQQRRSQFVPEVVLDDRQFSVLQRGPAEKPKLVLINRGALPNLNLLSPSGLFLRCRNVGFGVAKDVSFHMSFDAQAFAERIADADPTLAVAIEVDELVVLGEDWGAIREEKGYLGAVLQASQGDEREVRLPFAYEGLLGDFLRGSHPDSMRGGLSDWDVPPLEIALSYRDLEGVAHSKRYRASVHIHSMQGLRSDVEDSSEWQPFAQGVIEVRDA